VSAVDDIELKNVVFSVGGKQLGTDSSAPYSLSWDTAAVPDGPHAVVARAFDLAGNSAAVTISIVVRNTSDRTPPQLTLETQHGALWPPTGKLVPMTFTGRAADDTSAIGVVSFHVQDEYGRIQPYGTVDVTNGRFSFTVYLEASRRGQDRDGRQYLVTVTAHDLAGNQAKATTEAVVPHDHRSAR
jgi:Bacterial Ig domain